MSLIEPAHNSPPGNPNAYIGRPLAKERWKKMRRLGSRPPNRTLFLAISLLVHGAVFLGLEVYWPSVAEQPLQTQPKTLTPVKFVEVPADRLGVKPPLNAKLRAANNSSAGGKARPDLPIETGALATKSTVFLPSIKPSSTKSKSSTPQPRQVNTPSQPPQLAQRKEPLSQATNNLSSSPPVAQSTPKQQPTPQPRQVDTPPQVPPVAQSVPKPQPTPQPSSPTPEPQITDNPNNSSKLAQSVPKPQPAPQAPSPDPEPQTDEPDSIPVPKPQSTPQQRQTPSRRLLSLRTSYIPNITSNVAQNVPKPQPSPQPSQHALAPKTPQGTPHRNSPPQTNNKPNNGSSGDQAVPRLRSSSSQPPRKNASVLGGPVTLASNSFTGASSDNLANSNRLTSDVQGIDAQQDVDFGPYLKRLKQKVAQQWPHQKIHSSRSTLIGFSIRRSGQVADLSILETSGSPDVDQEALAAIRRAAPFDPLPENYQGNEYDIHFRFNIFILNAAP